MQHIWLGGKRQAIMVDSGGNCLSYNINCSLYYIVYYIFMFLMCIRDRDDVAPANFDIY